MGLSSNYPCDGRGWQIIGCLHYSHRDDANRGEGKDVFELAEGGRNGRIHYSDAAAEKLDLTTASVAAWPIVCING